MEKKSKIKNVHSGHRKRVKANVCKNGFSQLEDHKLLELLLFYSIPQADTNELAHKLLAEFGSLDELLKADVNSLKRVDGVGENTAVLLATAGELFIRTGKSKAVKKRCYKTTDDYKALALSQLVGESVEKVVIFCFDSSGRLKKTLEISSGDEASAFIDVRKAVQAVIDCDAKKAVLAHNHPGGVCDPSASDVDATRSVCVMFRKLGFFLVDHIITGVNNTAYSMYSDSDYKQMFY